MISTQFDRGVKFNPPSWIWPVELGVNPLRLWPPNLNAFYPNQPASISMDLHPIWGGVKFNPPSWIWPVELGVNPLRLWPPNLNAFLPKSTSIYLNGFTPNLRGGQIQSPSVKFDWALITGQIGWKFIEITLSVKGIQLASISMDLHPIWPGINCWSNWVEIHWDFIAC